ncbi:hypothetical protein [Hyphomicrobium sp. NDB2Meth4]|uniref:hypothetical protein n=1 Tax=Hyphomicrobium sp. NDB2Meth4 TaxID=1892846 RepID=UPI00093075AD|nr:hypothetical protein [Hyphomicrobium sp. NDB2Meth4]
MAQSHSRAVRFAHAFSLEGVEGTFPSGTYVVEETTEPVEGLTFVGYRRTKTTIELPWSGSSNFSRQLVEIDPAALETALARDALAIAQNAQQAPSTP